MVLNDVEIIEGEEVKECLGAGELDDLVSLWMDETYTPVTAPVSRTRELIEGVLGGLPMGERLVSLISGVREKLRDCFPQFSSTRQFQNYHKEEFRWQLTDHLRESLERGDVVVARKDGKVIGMVRVYKFEQVAPNQFVDGDVYEIGKALVVPENRGQGVYSKLRKQAIAHLREKYGDVPIISGTKTESVKKLNRGDGWTEIGFANYLRIHGVPDEYVDSQKEASKKEGWTAFLCVPNHDK